MKYATYKVIKSIAVIAVAVLTAWSTLEGIPWVPVPVALAAMLVLWLTRSAVKETVIDERTYSIANRASRFAFQWGVLAIALIGATLAALGRSSHPEYLDVSYGLLYAAAGMTVLYTVSYYIIAARLGGSE